MISIDKIINIDLDIEADKVTSVNNYGTTLYFYPSGNGVSASNKLYNSYSEIYSEYSESEEEKVSLLLKNVAEYFNNGGKKIVVCGINSYTLSEFESIINDVRNNLANDFIYIVISNECFGSNGYGSQVSYTNINGLCSYCESLNSPYKVRLCITTNSKTEITDKNLFDFNVVVKYSTTKVMIGSNQYLLDAALLVPAYFSQIKLDEFSSIKDYCYTKEQLSVDGFGICNLTSSEYDSMKENYNFIDKIGNNIVNFGGNYANGTPISLEFGAICLENALSYAILDCVINKQYLTSIGLTNVVSIINGITNSYVDNGYIQNDALYSGETYKYTYNGISYTVVSKGEVLEKGFKVFAIPISNMSSSDRANKKFTPIIVVIETAKGARVISIKGVVK